MTKGLIHHVVHRAEKVGAWIGEPLTWPFEGTLNMFTCGCHCHCGSRCIPHECFSCVRNIKDTQNQIGCNNSWYDGWNWLCATKFAGEELGPLFGKSCARGVCVISKLLSSLLDSSHGVEAFRADV